MSTFFTKHAAERMKQLDVSEADVTQLLAKLDTTESGADLARWPDTINLKDNPDGTVYVISSGSMRAVVTTAKSKPDRLIVMSVYDAGNDKEAGAILSATSKLRAVARAS